MSKLKKNIRLDVTTMLNKIVSGSTSEDRHGNNQYIPYNGTDSKSITVHDGHRCRDGNFRYVFEKGIFSRNFDIEHVITLKCNVANCYKLRDRRFLLKKLPE